MKDRRDEEEHSIHEETTPINKSLDQAVPANKISEEIKESLIAHIHSYHPTVSHYRRKHAPLRKYLPCGLSVAKLYANFIDKNPDLKLSYEKFRLIFKTLNISFAKLGEEECEECKEFENHVCPKMNEKNIHK